MIDTLDVSRLVCHWFLHSFLVHHVHNIPRATICCAKWKKENKFLSLHAYPAVTPHENCNIIPQNEQSVAMNYMNLPYVFQIHTILCFYCLEQGEWAAPALGNNNRTFLHSVQSISCKPESWWTVALHLNPNTILHSDSESCCQGIQDLFACNCLILLFLQAHRELQPTNRQPNLAYWGTVQGCNTVSFT